MFLVDTHAHLYLDDFINDRKAVIDNAIQNGVHRILLPNIDVESIESLLAFSKQFPTVCFPMMGLHPTSVKQDFLEQLEIIKSVLLKQNFIAVGEVGIDLYWDKSFLKEQQKALEIQIEWALSMNLPIVFHMRDSFNELWNVVKSYSDLKGVFHCYSGTHEQAIQIIEKGFFLGIGGVVTYKKSSLPDILKNISLDYILLETDAPFLTPVPFRGKRNESSYIKLIAEQIATIKGISFEEVTKKTTANAMVLFFKDEIHL